MAFTKSKLYAINAVVLGLMVLSYYFPVLRFFIFIPLLMTSIIQLIAFFGKDVKFNKIVVLNAITAVFAISAYTVALFLKDKILYVFAALIAFWGIKWIIIKVFNIPTEPLDSVDDSK